MSKVTGDGSVFLTEKANADADVAGDGQLWVKTATPNELMFTDDTGQDFDISQPTTLATEQATTSGTSIDFTGIPSGVKKISVEFVNVRTSGTSVPIIQLGNSGGVVTTGYVSNGCLFGGSPAFAQVTSGINMASTWAAAYRVSGFLNLELEREDIHRWVSNHMMARIDGAGLVCGGGAVTLTNVIDRIRITTVGGTDTFDLGAVNIQYSF